MEDLPSDSDGQALRMLAGLGHNLSKPMLIDFFIAVPSEQAGLAVAQAAEGHGYMASVEFDDEDQEWTCYCSCVMVPTYPGLIAAQSELEQLASPHGGHPDGWAHPGISTRVAGR
jgi:Regulator of ribonuclease activity B